MRFKLFVNAAITGYMFGLWQQSVQAGCFMFILLGFILSVVDYVKENKSLKIEVVGEKQNEAA